MLKKRVQLKKGNRQQINSIYELTDTTRLDIIQGLVSLYTKNIMLLGLHVIRDYINQAKFNLCYYVNLYLYNIQKLYKGGKNG